MKVTEEIYGIISSLEALTALTALTEHEPTQEQFRHQSVQSQVVCSVEVEKRMMTQHGLPWSGKNPQNWSILTEYLL